jgi:hypothetical protein
MHLENYVSFYYVSNRPMQELKHYIRLGTQYTIYLQEQMKPLILFLYILVI